MGGSVGAPFGAWAASVEVAFGACGVSCGASLVASCGASLVASMGASMGDSLGASLGSLACVDSGVAGSPLMMVRVSKWYRWGVSVFLSTKNSSAVRLGSAERAGGKMSAWKASDFRGT